MGQHTECRRQFARLLVAICVGAAQSCGSGSPSGTSGVGHLEAGASLDVQQEDDTLVMDGAPPADEDAGNSGTSAAFLELQRGGGLGFCIERGHFVHAELRYTAGAAELVVQGAVYRGCDRDAASCGGVISDYIHPIVPFALSPSERATVELLAEKLPPMSCAPRISPICEYCLTTRIEAKGLSYLDNRCAEPSCWTPDMTLIASFIDGLSPP